MTDKCITCKMFDRDGNAPPRIPGVRDNYRKCTALTMHRVHTDKWTHPTNWCDKFEKREGKVTCTICDGGAQTLRDGQECPLCKRVWNASR